MSEKLTYKQTPEKKERLKIREVKLKSELPGLSGHSVESFHGAIENTKGVIIEVDTDKGIYELVALFAKYVQEEGKYIETPSGKPRWQLTDLKSIKISAKYGPTFELCDLGGEISDQLSEEIEKRFIDENGKWKS